MCLAFGSMFHYGKILNKNPRMTQSLKTRSHREEKSESIVSLNDPSEDLEHINTSRSAKVWRRIVFS